MVLSKQKPLGFLVIISRDANKGVCVLHRGVLDYVKRHLSWDDRINQNKAQTSLREQAV